MTSPSGPFEVKTYCRICPSACGLVAEVAGGRVVSVRGDREHPLTGGYSCAKGRRLPALHHGPGRLLAPKMGRGAEQVTVGWEEVLDDLAGRLRGVIERHGPGAVGVFLGGGGYMDSLCYWTARRIPAALGTPQFYSDMTIDAVAKVVATELVAGSALAIARPDFGRCRFVLYIGTNPLVSHGHMAIFANPTRLQREMMAQGEVWVIDPRRTETAAKATRHLAARPGSDHAILAFLVREILREGADRDYIAAHTQDVERLAEAVEPYHLARAVALSGLEPEALNDLATAIRRAGRIAVENGTGTAMSPSGAVVHWLGLALMAVTGSLDREGGVWFNPGFHARADTRAIPSAPPEGFLSPGPASRPELFSRGGEYPSVALPDEIEAGNLRALINVGGNLVACMPQTERTIAALGKLDVLATLEVMENDTTRLSSHVLPTKAQLERADTPLATDLMYPAIATSVTGPVVAPAGEVRSGWWVLAQLGQRLDVDFVGGFDAQGGDDADLLAKVTEHSSLPLSAGDGPGFIEAGPARFGWFLERVDGFGGWRLAPRELVRQLAGLDVPRGGLTMISRRRHHHFNSRTDPDREPAGILLSAEDAAGAGLADGAMAVVRSAHGALTGRVRIDPTLSPGVMNVPHGFTETNANRLTSLSQVDPVSGMAMFSGLAVTVEPA